MSVVSGISDTSFLTRHRTSGKSKRPSPEEALFHKGNLREVYSLIRISFLPLSDQSFQLLADFLKHKVIYVANDTAPYQDGYEVGGRNNIVPS